MDGRKRIERFEFVQFSIPSMNGRQDASLLLEVDWDCEPNGRAIRLLLKRGDDGVGETFDSVGWLERNGAFDNPVTVLRMYLSAQNGMLVEHIDHLIVQLFEQDQGVPNRSELNWALRNIIEAVRGARRENGAVSFTELVLTSRVYRRIFKLNEDLSGKEQKQALAGDAKVGDALEAYAIIGSLLEKRTVGIVYVDASILQADDLRLNLRGHLRLLDKRAKTEPTPKLLELRGELAAFVANVSALTTRAKRRREEMIPLTAKELLKVQAVINQSISRPEE